MISDNRQYNRDPCMGGARTSAAMIALLTISSINLTAMRCPAACRSYVPKDPLAKCGDNERQNPRPRVDVEASR